MTQIEDLQNHLQFQLSLLHLTKIQDQGAGEKRDSDSEIQEQEDLVTALDSIAQAMQ